METTMLRVGFQVSRANGGDWTAGLSSTLEEGAELLEVFLDRERPGDVDPALVLDLSARARAAGLPLQLHSSYGFADNLGRPPLRDAFRLAHALGAPTVTVHLDDLLAAPESPDWAAARDLGLTVAIENVPKAASLPGSLIAYLERLPAEVPVGVAFDVGHANLSPLGALEYAHRLIGELARIGRRIVSTHLHDNDGSADDHRILGEGTIDFPRLLPLLRDAAGCRRFVIERWGGRQTCLRRARRWLGTAAEREEEVDRQNVG